MGDGLAGVTGDFAARVTRALSPNQAANDSLYDDTRTDIWHFELQRNATCKTKMDFTSKVKLISFIIFKNVKYSGNVLINPIGYKKKDY